MRWFISSNGQTQGPFEEQVAINMLRVDPMAHVRGEAGGAWMPAAQSPFAGYLYPPPTSPIQATPQGETRVNPRPMITGAQWLLMIAVVSLWIVSAKTPWLGLLLGVALVGWTIYRHRKGQRSVVGIAFARSGSFSTATATVLLGLLFSTCSASGAYSAHQESLQKDWVAADASAAMVRKAQQQAQQHTALLQQMPDKIRTWQSALSTAFNAADSADLTDAARDTATAQEQIETFSKMLGAPTPPELAQLDGIARVQAESLKARSDLYDSIKEVDGDVSRAKKYIIKQSWLEADEAFASALRAVQDAQSVPEAMKSFVPHGFDPAKRQTEITRQRQAIAGPVAQLVAKRDRDEKKRQADEAKAANYFGMCGESPTVSGWDGAVVGLESALKETANDPSSIDVSDCTAPTLTDKICWLFSCDVRGKNGFGALILLRKTFSYNQVSGFQDVTGSE